MRTATIASLAAAVALSGLPWSQTVSATSGIQRCSSADGITAYTDRACPSVGGTAMPLPGEVLSRIAAEEARHASSGVALDSAMPAVTRSGSVGRRSPQSGCARSKRQLAMDLRGSFALHNVNRLAESYHWVGKSNRQAQQQMLRLERMADASLREVRYFGSGISSGASTDDEAGEAAPYPAPRRPPSGQAGSLQLTLSKGGSLQVMDLGVTRYSGCYFATI